mmetsp:Transcript_59762/g.159015  ORF Transcript_59762/g.159015 Transcript_59762/m.159015 type:complete len:80 (-) Transcript_59762:404-643(-)
MATKLHESSWPNPLSRALSHLWLMTYCSIYLSSAGSRDARRLCNFGITQFMINKNKQKNILFHGFADINQASYLIVEFD